MISAVSCVDVTGNCFTAASSCDVVVNFVSCVTFDAYDGQYLGQITVNQLVLYGSLDVDVNLIL